MNQPRCTITLPHCESCGSTENEDVFGGDQGYSDCCNEIVVLDMHDCRAHHIPTINPLTTER